MSKRPNKYDRVSIQKKFHLIKLIQKQGLSIKQAAKQLQINYSTAKTILFFYRKKGQISQEPINSMKFLKQANTAQYQAVKHYEGPFIKIISSIGGQECGEKQKNVEKQDSSIDKIKIQEC